MNKLYRIIKRDYDYNSGVLNSVIELDKAHGIFKGHFPGNPVLPGVCTLQIAKELLCGALGKDLRLAKSSNIKYPGFISPLVTPQIHFHITNSQTGRDNINCRINESQRIPG